MLTAFLLAVLQIKTIAKPVAPGIEYVQELQADPPRVIHVLRVSPKEPRVSVRVRLAGDYVHAADNGKGREQLLALADRHEAVAAVNGDFFPWTGDPLGLCVIGGELVSEPARNRAAFGWTAEGAYLFGNPTFEGAVTSADGREVPIHGVNRECGDSENVLWLPSGGRTAVCAKKGRALVFRALSRPVPMGGPFPMALQSVTDNAASVPLPADGAVLFVRKAENGAGPILKPGGVWTFRMAVRDGVEWSKAAYAIGGGPWLVRGGAAAVDGAEEGFDASFIAGRHPRTAIGHTLEGELLLVAVEGRGKESVGASLAEMAEIMLRYGAVTAMNLDGGGSTEMIVRGIGVSTVSDGASRPIANAIVVDSAWSERRATKLAIAPFAPSVTVGDTLTLQVTDERSGSVLPQSHVLWGCSPGLARIDQFGTLTALKSGLAVVSAYCHGSTLRTIVLIAVKRSESGEP